MPRGGKAMASEWKAQTLGKNVTGDLPQLAECIRIPTEADGEATQEKMAKKTKTVSQATADAAN